MSISVNIKKVLVTILFATASAVAMAQGVTTTAGKGGIFVYCGKQLPKKFSYLIERKKAGDTAWQVITETIFPKTVDAMQGNILAAPSSLLVNQQINNTNTANVWQKAKTATTLDSLYPYTNMPLYVFAMGCGYFDAITEPGTYSYRVSVIKNGSKESLPDVQVAYPARPYNVTVQPLKMSVLDEAINFTFSISDATVFGGAKLFRAKYADTVYKEVPATVLFTGDTTGKLQLNITDAGVTPKMAYSYYVVPLDILANEGIKSEVVNVFNASKLHDIGLALKLTAKGIDAEKAIKLAWKLNNTNGLISIDVYRGTDYNQPFTRIASVSATDTVYIDENIQPTTTYYYSITANGNYGRSNPSTRVSAILKGGNNNLFPPQNITINRTGNIVSLTFNKAERDTRGYYIYRGLGYNGKLTMLPKMLLSTDSSVTYYDTLPISISSKIYSYAVADVNTSYNISPLSSRFSVIYSGTVPVPTRVKALYNSGSVLLVWEKAAANQTVTGYNIYRTATDEDGNVKETSKLLTDLQKPVANNSFTDSSITDGWHYSYIVQSVGLQTNDVSSNSANASVTIPAAVPLAPANISVMSVQQNVTLKWDAPVDATAKTVRIYRAAVNGAFTLLKELPVDNTSFNDTSVITGTTYFYTLTTANVKNRESKKTDAVGIHVK